MHTCSAESISRAASTHSFAGNYQSHIIAVDVSADRVMNMLQAQVKFANEKKKNGRHLLALRLRTCLVPVCIAIMVNHLIVCNLSSFAILANRLAWQWVRLHWFIVVNGPFPHKQRPDDITTVSIWLKSRVRRMPAFQFRITNEINILAVICRPTLDAWLMGALHMNCAVNDTVNG